MLAKNSGNRWKVNKHVIQTHRDWAPDLAAWRSLLRDLKVCFSTLLALLVSIWSRNGGCCCFFDVFWNCWQWSTIHKWGREETSSLVNVQWTFTERIPSRRPGWYDNISENCLATFSTMLVTVCAQNWCGLFCKDVSKFFLLSVRSFLGCLWRILPWTTLSYSSRSWMDRRNSILLFGRHSHCIRFKVKGLKHFTPPKKKYYIFLFFWEKTKFCFLLQFFLSVKKNGKLEEQNQAWTISKSVWWRY